jgi:hypothetical protein
LTEELNGTFVSPFIESQTLSTIYSQYILYQDHNVLTNVLNSFSLVTLNDQAVEKTQFLYLDPTPSELNRNVNVADPVVVQVIAIL